MIEEIVKLADKEEDAAAGELATFARIMLAATSTDDLERFEPATLLALIRQSFDFIRVRKSGERKLRVVERQIDGAPESHPGAYTLVEIHNRDMPFLVDSTIGELEARNLEVAFIAHPILLARRDCKGRLLALTERRGALEGATCESYIRIHLPPLPRQSRETLARELESILESVAVVVDDWKLMLARVDEVIRRYEASPPKVHDIDEAIAFLRWLDEGHFTFLGVRALSLKGDIETGTLEPSTEGGLGILRNPEVRVLRRGRELVHMTPEVRKFYAAPQALIVTKSNVVSKVHRRAHMDYIGAKLYGADGTLAGELRIVGLFTSGAYTRAPRNIPLLRRKVAHVLDAFGFAPDSHDGKALVNVLETFPRDELFQISLKDLRRFAAGILDLELRPRTRVFVRVDEFDRFVSVLIYVPRDRYSTLTRQRIGQHLAEVYKGVVSAFYPSFGSGPLVRVHFIIGRYEGETPRVSEAALEAAVRAIIRDWEDELAEAIGQAFKGDRGAQLVERYRKAFSAGYKDNFRPERATADIAHVERLGPDNPIAIDFHDEAGAPAHQARVAIYSLEASLPLSRRVPIFENMGFSVIDERSFKLRPIEDGLERVVQLHDMLLETRDRAPLDLDAHQARLEACFLAIARGRAIDDHFNRLIVAAGLSWRQATVMRALAAYMRQIGAPFGQRYVSDTLVRHPAITRDLWRLFEIRFEPTFAGGDVAARKQAQEEVIGAIETALGNVQSLDEDRIIRQLRNLIVATVRTNFYLFNAPEDEEAEGAETLSFKLASRHIENAPEPKPFAEIFVYSPRVEGVHLRGGPIARGGIRWSDRAQDYRTEVLGLAKAQQVKNAVIVPVGAKGGFVPKELPLQGTREEILAEGVAAYKIFVNALIELTDNLEGDKIVPPARVVRHDDDDPYLVVAADKGTAAFSDHANEIAKSRGFWLGDAFASGGSAGYDHKKMGITARGAWEAVKRHFREMDIDIQTTPFTVLGIGDMSGDVFGNGMLLSKQIRLVAAFDHRDIFIDPDPDPEASWHERKRLFEMGRSSWQDYDKALISKGGGVYSRSAKAIPLSAEMRALTGLTGAKATPNQLIHALLKSRFDLLWLGGIGTFVKASDESDESVGDRANDAIRVTAAELKVRVIGEGANLGLTQRARIEFAQAGGRVNTDAIDNSAGVNSSDLEVNIKIALRPAVQSGRLSMKARNALLARMTDEVAAACLRNNYLQTLALSLGERRGLADLGFQQQLMRTLEAAGELDRELEALPSDGEIEARRQSGRPLTRPELAVLLGYAKIALQETLVASRVPDDPAFEKVLFEYFPKEMRKAHAAGIKGHRLRREIIAMHLANTVINRGGSTMVVRLGEETGHGEADIVMAYWAVAEVFGLEALWRRIDALDNRVPGRLQLDLYLEVQQLVRAASSWFLRHADFSAGLGPVLERFCAGVAAYVEALDGALTERQRAFVARRSARFVEAGVPEGLAREIARLDFAADAPNAVLVAERTGRDIAEVVAPFAQLDDYFRIGELRARAEEMAVEDYFDRLAINSTLAILSDAHRQLAVGVLGHPGGFEGWCAQDDPAIVRTKQSLDDILDSGNLTLARLTVAASQARDLIPS